MFDPYDHISDEFGIIRHHHRRHCYPRPMHRYYEKERLYQTLEIDVAPVRVFGLSALD